MDEQVCEHGGHFVEEDERRHFYGLGSGQLTGAF